MNGVNKDVVNEFRRNGAEQKRTHIKGKKHMRKRPNFIVPICFFLAFLNPESWLTSTSPSAICHQIRVSWSWLWDYVDELGT